MQMRRNLPALMCTTVLQPTSSLACVEVRVWLQRAGNMLRSCQVHPGPTPTGTALPLPHVPAPVGAELTCLQGRNATQLPAGASAVMGHSGYQGGHVAGHVPRPHPTVTVPCEVEVTGPWDP